MDGSFSSESKGESWGRSAYSVHRNAQAEREEHREPILASPNRTKVYRDAKDLLRRTFVLGGVQKVIYQNLLVRMYREPSSQ